MKALGKFILMVMASLAIFTALALMDEYRGLIMSFFKGRFIPAGVK